MKNEGLHMDKYPNSPKA